MTYDSTYYVRAYAKNKVGISYGKQLSFTTEYQVGEKGPAGGVIFYDKVSKDNGWRYLETTYTDVDLIGPAGCNLTVEINTDSAIGYGLENTAKIIELCNQSLIGAKLAKNYKLNGFTDWFLPSYFELKKIYESNLGQSPNKALLKVADPYKGYRHLSSTQRGTAGAAMIGIDSYYGLFNGDNGRSADNYIRPVRRFK